MTWAVQMMVAKPAGFGGPVAVPAALKTVGSKPRCNPKFRAFRDMTDIPVGIFIWLAEPLWQLGHLAWFHFQQTQTPGLKPLRVAVVRPAVFQADFLAVSVFGQGSLFSPSRDMTENKKRGRP